MPDARDTPGWATKIPATDSRRLVTCGGCGETMPWRTFALRHLRTCDDPEDGEGGRGDDGDEG